MVQARIRTIGIYTSSACITVTRLTGIYNLCFNRLRARVSKKQRVMLPRQYCQYKNTRSGKPCMQPPMANGLCVVHGGSPTNEKFEHKEVRQGRINRYIPDSLIEMYQEARMDDQLLDLEDNIALLDTRIAMLLLYIQEGESYDSWNRIREVAAVLLDANSKLDRTRIDAAIGDLEEILCTQTNSSREWDEINTLQQQRVKLVESQRKYEIEKERFIPIDVVLENARLLLDAVRQNVDDPEVLSRIQASFSASLRTNFGGGLVTTAVEELSDGGGDNLVRSGGNRP